MYKCECNKQFKNVQGLNAHLRFCDTHTNIGYKESKYKINENLYVCECDKQFDKAQSLNAHFSHCLIHRNGKLPVNKNFGNNQNWKRGLSESNDLRVKKFADSLRKYYYDNKGNIKGHPHTDETKNKLSKIRTLNMLQGKGNSKWFNVNGIKVQGTWERDVAIWLTDNNIHWERKYLVYDKIKRYTPDFYLPEYNLYIEVKGWMKYNDILKMKAVINLHKIDIRLIEYNELKKLHDINILELPKFIERYN